MSRSFAFVLVALAFIAPQTASASVLSFLSHNTAEASVPQTLSGTVSNSQKMPLAEASIGPGILSGENAKPQTEILIKSDSVLAPEVGPLGSSADVADLPDTVSGITFYTVHDGDTVSAVAKLFGVTSATIYSANNLKSGAALSPGQVLTILPVSGTQYTVKKGDTIKSIAFKFKVDQSDVSFYNNFSSEADLVAGDTIIIPNSSFDGTSDTTSPAKKSTSKSSSPKQKTPVVNADGLVVGNNNGKNTSPIEVHPLKDSDKIDLGDAILRPVDASVSRVSQYGHGWHKTGADIAAPLGTPIRAPYDGVVLLARSSGYNDGYGTYAIITSNIDGNQVEFILAHMSKVIVTAGQTVERGETIGFVGMTGDATGDHVHFEVRGALNPWTIPANRNKNTE